jgi:hypothetical protein
MDFTNDFNNLILGDWYKDRTNTYWRIESKNQSSYGIKSLQDTFICLDENRYLDLKLLPVSNGMNTSLASTKKWDYVYRRLT